MGTFGVWMLRVLRPDSCCAQLGFSPEDWMSRPHLSFSWPGRCPELFAVLCLRLKSHFKKPFLKVGLQEHAVDCITAQCVERA
mgnify:CR=1 FL=1